MLYSLTWHWIWSILHWYLICILRDYCSQSASQNNTDGWWSVPPGRTCAGYEILISLSVPALPLPICCEQRLCWHIEGDSEFQYWWLPLLRGVAKTWEVVHIFLKSNRGQNQRNQSMTRKGNLEDHVIVTDFYIVSRNLSFSHYDWRQGFMR